MKDATKRILLHPITSAVAKPLYQQVVDALKTEITEGRLKSGELLPSFRQLAEQLMVSLITVKRAYEELERQGIIYRRQGMGTFVSEDGQDRNQMIKRENAQTLMRDALKEALESGLSRDEIRQMFERLEKEQF
ncbi:MAG TPA: GntR family transcriptional regulator [bacterium]|nr:GntR family transcriptional regulator [bacterium]